MNLTYNFDKVFTGFLTIITMKSTVIGDIGFQHGEDSDKEYVLGSGLVCVNLFDRKGRLRTFVNQQGFFEINFQMKVIKKLTPDTFICIRTISTIQKPLKIQLFHGSKAIREP